MTATRGSLDGARTTLIGKSERFSSCPFIPNHTQLNEVREGVNGWIQQLISFLLKKRQIPLIRMRSLSAAAARPPARRGGLAAAALGAVLNVSS